MLGVNMTRPPQNAADCGTDIVKAKSAQRRFPLHMESFVRSLAFPFQTKSAVLGSGLERGFSAQFGFTA